MVKKVVAKAAAPSKKNAAPAAAPKAKAVTKKASAAVKEKKAVTVAVPAAGKKGKGKKEQEVVVTSSEEEEEEEEEESESNEEDEEQSGESESNEGESVDDIIAQIQAVAKKSKKSKNNEESDEEMAAADDDEASLEEDNGTSSEEEDDEEEEGEGEANDQEMKEENENENENEEDEDEEMEEDDEDDESPIDEGVTTGPRPSTIYTNKQRCLVISSRGVTARFRHLLEDLRTLIPHHKKDSKLDEKDQISTAIRDICEVKSCNSALYLECRKKSDVYMWVSLTPNGPSAKFHLSNAHTMDELKLTGNCLKGSRPLLTFTDEFNKMPHMKLLKSMFIDIFNTPNAHPKSKPFVDRVMSFFYADGKIWVRNYQINEEIASNALEARMKKQGGLDTSLVEIGPRFTLDLIRIFANAFGGQTLFQNADYESPNTTRSNVKKGKGDAYSGRKAQQESRKERQDNFVVAEDPLNKVFN
jgi:ribosome biogenesis protein BRX1